MRAGIDQTQCNGLGFFIQDLISSLFFFSLNIRLNCTTLVLGVWKDWEIPSVHKETPGERTGAVIEHLKPSEDSFSLFPFLLFFYL